ncbi:12224_t:CDS:10 [Acaulospora morrowiae]|uniref:non-specific serine/threonine protein kinase n=1 Tax=Acaulospora morrowiae TaxID=94023 RepID=A0A9N9A0K5_9GLOM|nr:12224_t:CDS:10 [Acaulospora morrowiae]
MTENIRSINNSVLTTRGSQRIESRNFDDLSAEKSPSLVSKNGTLRNKRIQEEFPLKSGDLAETIGSFTDPKCVDKSLVFNKVKSFRDVNQLDAGLTLKNSHKFANNARDPNVIESKRRQGRLLLVSLLEDFCSLYDSNPEKNHKLFYAICKSLSAMGIIDEEVSSRNHTDKHENFFHGTKDLTFFKFLKYIDEVSTVRFTYYRAFKALVVQALNSIKREQSSVESHMIVSSVSEAGSNKIDNDLDNVKNLTFGDILDLQNSRYSNDFVEIKLLGKGGFASVWQAKNKLDGVDYAIKKIRLRGDKIPGEKEKIFREIKFLARLEHTNVIRYYSSWLEHVYNRQREESSKESCESLLDTNSSREFESSSSGSLVNSNDDSDIFRMSFSDEESKSDEYSGVDFVGEDFSAVGGLHLEPSANAQSQSCNNFSHESHNSSGECKVESLNIEKDWTLFIQMQLCHTTLYDYLKHRDVGLLTKKDPLNAINRRVSIELFRGIVRGVAYIHEQGLIHRDLKPGNIFMDVIHESGQDSADSLSLAAERLVPKIGDFGLVTAVIDDHLDLPTESYTKSKVFNFGSAPEGSSSKKHIINGRSSSSLSYGSRSRTTGVGTITYASPEQLAKPVRPYNEKVDIYSLGIIFFELHYPFSTGHERIQVLKDLRNGILPDEFVQRFPKEAAFILWMVAEDPDQRPNAKQILEFELLAEPIHGEQEMQNKLVKSTQVIDSIKKENEILKRKIAELEEKLSMLAKVIPATMPSLHGICLRQEG